MRPTTLALTLLLFCLSQAAGLVLRRVAKKDEATTYAGVYEVSSDKMKAQVKTKTLEKVLGVNQDGSFVVEGKTLESKFVVDGKETDGPDLSVTTAYDSTGHIVSMDGVRKTEAEAYRFANLTRIFWPTAPLNDGDSWEAQTPAGPASGGVALSSRFSLMGSEEVDDIPCDKVIFMHQETSGDHPAVCKGEMWLEQGTGRLIRVVGKATDAPVGGERVALSISISAVKTAP